MNFEQIDRLMKELGHELCRLAEDTSATNYCCLLINVSISGSGSDLKPKVTYGISVLADGATVQGATRLQDLIDEYRRRSGWATRQKMQALPAPAEVSFAPAAPPTDKPVPRVDTDDIAF